MLPLLAAGSRSAVLGCAVAVAMLGALTGPPAATAGGALLGGAVAVAAVLLGAWGLDGERPSPRTLAYTGTTGALVVPTALGLPLLGWTAPVLVLALLVVGPVRPAGAVPGRAGASAPPVAGASARRR